MESSPIDLPFLAGMAHELRTPLAAIGGYAELLEHGMHGPVTDAQLDALRRIKRNQQTMIALIAASLDFAEIALGQASAARQEVDLVAAIAEARDAMSEELRARELIVAWPPPETTPRTVHADQRRVTQLLRYLLHDAASLAPVGSTVSVTASPLPDCVAIDVVSAGPAIANTDEEMVFHAFDRVGRAARGGQDLALPTARALARLLQGDVIVAPDDARGAVGSRRLRLTLPV